MHKKYTTNYLMTSNDVWKHQVSKITDVTASLSLEAGQLPTNLHHENIFQ